AAEYIAGEMPSGRAMADDLARMLELLRNASATGLDVSGDLEPTHLLLKWSRQYAEDTVARHKAVADEFGSTWWGVMSKRERVLGESIVAAIREQIVRGVLTYAFLYGGQEGWQARIHALTDRADYVDEARRPAYYSM